MNDPADKKTEANASRRNFLKAGAWAGAALAGGLTLGEGTSANGDETKSASGKLPIQISGYPFDRVKGLVDGSVQVEGCDASFVTSIVPIFVRAGNGLTRAQDRGALSPIDLGVRGGFGLMDAHD